MARHTTPPRLLVGPYHPPSLRRGDRTFCLFRDADVTVTSWTSAPIPWPRCCRPGTHGGGSGLRVTGDLARVVRTESAAPAGSRHACEGRAALVEGRGRGREGDGSPLQGEYPTSGSVQR